MFNLEQSIAEWRQQMLAAGIKSPVLLEELESHLREQIEELVKSGISEQRAFEFAVREIGHAEMLKVEFKKSEGAKEKTFQIVKDSLDLVFVILMSIVVALTFRFAMEWQPVAIIISHDGSPSHPMLNQMTGKLWGEETGLMQSICIAEVLLLSLVLSLAAAFHIRRNPQNSKRFKRVTQIGQWCAVLLGLKIISSNYPFWGLVMALISCLVFVIILRWQSRATTVSPQN